jgi:hypothetical protein
MNAKDIFEKLVQSAYSYSMRYSSFLSPGRRPRGKPGELVEKLSPEEREKLKNLSAKDTDASRHHLNYMIGSYPESTMTVHTHSLKKTEDE